MIFVVGLGNPGKKYEKTRHNIGFRVINEFYRKNRDVPPRLIRCGDVHIFPDFKYKKKFQALISKGKFNNKEILLAKPQTFMNNSGKAAKSIIKHYNLTSHGRLSCDLLVIHDDIDIPLGKIRIVKNRGPAGHKGVESIIRELKTKNFVRFRIGICPKTGKPQNPEKFVLEKFNKEKEKTFKEVIKKTAKTVEFFLKEGLEKTMNKFNK